MSLPNTWKAKLIRPANLDDRFPAAIYEIDPPYEGANYLFVESFACMIEGEEIGETTAYAWRGEGQGFVVDWDEDRVFADWIPEPRKFEECVKSAGYEVVE